MILKNTCLLLLKFFYKTLSNLNRFLLEMNPKAHNIEDIRSKVKVIANSDDLEKHLSAA